MTDTTTGDGGALIITADDGLLTELTRLAAAAGTSLDHVDDVGSALTAWQRASLVLVGADLLPHVAMVGPPRRGAVYGVSWGPPTDELYRPALEVGIEGVLALPDAADLVTELLTDVGDERPEDGIVVGVIGGSGGAGATTFGAALAQVGAKSGRTALLDADPLGPGADSVLGVEDAAGVRWGQLAGTTGRLSARSLRDALPRTDQLTILTWERGASPVDLPTETCRQVLSAARRGHGLVVIDLPRRLDALTDELMARCDLVLLVVHGTVAGVSSAARMVTRLPDPERARAVVRGTSTAPDAVERALGVPVLTAMADQRGLAESIDLGLGPVRSRRGPLGRAVREVLQRCSVHSTTERGAA